MCQFYYINTMCIFEFIFKLTKRNAITKALCHLLIETKQTKLFILVKLLSFQHADCILKLNGLFQCVKKKLTAFMLG